MCYEIMCVALIFMLYILNLKQCWCVPIFYLMERQEQLNHSWARKPNSVIDW